MVRGARAACVLHSFALSPQPCVAVRRGADATATTSTATHISPFLLAITTAALHALCPPSSLTRRAERWNECKVRGRVISVASMALCIDSPRCSGPTRSVSHAPPRATATASSVLRFLRSHALCANMAARAPPTLTHATTHTSSPLPIPPPPPEPQPSTSSSSPPPVSFAIAPTKGALCVTTSSPRRRSGRGMV